MKFSRTKNIKLVNIPTFFGKKKTWKITWKIEKLREKNVELFLGKKLSDKNDPKYVRNTIRILAHNVDITLSREPY